MEEHNENEVPDIPFNEDEVNPDFEEELIDSEDADFNEPLPCEYRLRFLLLKDHSLHSRPSL